MNVLAAERAAENQPRPHQRGGRAHHQLFSSTACRPGALSQSAVGTGSSYAALSTTEEEEDDGYENLIPELLEHYQLLELNEELQLAEETQRDMGEMWILGSRACASQLAHSTYMTATIASVIILDIAVSINLEPNPPHGRAQTDYELFALVLDIIATTMFTIEAFIRIHSMTFSGYWLSSGFSKHSSSLAIRTRCALSHQLMFVCCCQPLPPTSLHVLSAPLASALPSTGIITHKWKRDLENCRALR